MPQGRLIARLEFESVTPLWPGGPLGARTYYCTGRYCVGPFLPDSKQLVGRIRWLLRTVHASLELLSGRPIRDYGHVEGLASTLFGSTDSASKFIVSLRFETESLRGKEYLPRNLLAVLNRHVNKCPLLRRGKERLVDCIEDDGFALIRQELGIEKNVRSVPTGLVDFAKMVAVTRVRLALQSKRLEDMYQLQPLRPGIRATLDVRVRAGASVSCEEKALAVLSAIYTLSFLGLGKATSRGFGRFKLLTSYEVYDECVEQSSLKLLSSSFDSPEKLKESFFNVGFELIEYAAQILGYVTPKPSTIENLDASQLVIKTAVPALIVPLAYVRRERTLIERLVHPCPYPLRMMLQRDKDGTFVTPKLVGCKPLGSAPVKSIETALSAIGKAVLKSTWKYVHAINGSLNSIAEPGVAFHTWPLGLPRGSKSFGKDTGYYISEIPLSSEVCGSKPPRIKRDVRRQSLFIFTVACRDNSCFCLIEPFITYGDWNRMSKFLIHVGLHNRSLFHVVNVMYAAKNTDLGSRDASSKSCPQDPAGVAYPSPPTRSKALEPILDPIKATLKWLTYLLS